MMPGSQQYRNDALGAMMQGGQDQGGQDQGGMMNDCPSCGGEGGYAGTQCPTCGAATSQNPVGISASQNMTPLRAAMGAQQQQQGDPYAAALAQMLMQQPGQNRPPGY